MNIIQRFIIIIVTFQLTLACNSDTAPECFRTAGDAIQYNVIVAEFKSIHISQGIELIIKQGDVQEVTIHTGDNIKEYITAEIKDEELFITNANNCNWVRDYNTTTVYITTPVLEKVYSASQFSVQSEGILSFPALTLQSGLFSETASGTFQLEVNADAILIEDDQSCYYNISGTVNNLHVKFYDGDARFDGANLIAQQVELFQRSTNDIVINPQEEIKGTIYSTGNIILVNKPPVINIEQLYTGHIIYP